MQNLDDKFKTYIGAALIEHFKKINFKNPKAHQIYKFSMNINFELGREEVREVNISEVKFTPLNKYFKKKAVD